MSFLLNPFMLASAGAPALPSIGDTWEFWEPARESLSNNDPISTLTGQINSRHCTSTTTERPTYQTNQINGLAAAFFDGDNDHLDMPDFTGITAAHMFFVVKLDADPPVNSNESGWSTITGDAVNSLHFPFTDGTIYDGTFSTARKTTGNPAASLADWRVYEIISTSGEWTNKVDGTQVFTTATNTVSAPASSMFGQNLANHNLHGHLAGMYLFDAKLSSGDRTTLIDYINDRFGLSSS